MRPFVLEARRSDGQPYPPATLRSLVSGIQRGMQSQKAPFLLLDRSDTRFRELHLTLNSVSSDLHCQGVGATCKSATVISVEDDACFWEKGVMGTSSPAVLQNTVFFYLSLHFVLRGIQEQHDLLVEQLQRVQVDMQVYSDTVYYKYTEYISKNNQHRFKDVQIHNKEGRIYAQPGSPHCLVKLLDLYCSKLPLSSKYFYMRPLAKVPADNGKAWYTRQRVGLNKLKELLPNMCKDAGTKVRYTNHSL